MCRITTRFVDHVLKHCLAWLRLWYIEATFMLSDVSLQFVPVLQFQKGSKTPHQAEDK